MGKFATGFRRSSPTILTALGIVGVVGTAVTAVRATPKALRLIKAKKDELETDISFNSNQSFSESSRVRPFPVQHRPTDYVGVENEADCEGTMGNCL